LLTSSEKFAIVVPDLIS